MANPRHGKERPMFNTRLGIILILVLAAIIGGVIWFFLRPMDVSTVTAPVAQHVHPNTGRIIAKAPQAKAKALTAAQLHVYHVRHVVHVLHLHVLHVRHVLHETHLAYLDHVYG